MIASMTGTGIEGLWLWIASAGIIYAPRYLSTLKPTYDGSVQVARTETRCE